jgi:RNA polymerase sigma-70 factor (family 1)
MYSSYTDQQLLSLLKDDSTTAFNTIYDRYSKMLYLYIFSKLDTGEISKDVLQDLFISLWEKRHTLSIHESLKSYLFQVARHKIVDIYRKNATYRKYLQQLIEHFDAQPHTITESIDYKNKTQELFEAINHLPEKMKEVFMLSRFEHLTVDQIASRLGLSQQTVKNQITKALKILRANYAKSDIILVIFSTYLLDRF